MIAATLMTAILDAFTEAGAASPQAGDGGGPVPAAAAALDRDLAVNRQWAADHPAAPPDALRRALTFWTRLHGVISLEVAGHFTDMKFDPALLYAAETEAAIGAL